MDLDICLPLQRRMEDARCPRILPALLVLPFCLQSLATIDLSPVCVGWSLCPFILKNAHYFFFKKNGLCIVRRREACAMTCACGSDPLLSSHRVCPVDLTHAVYLSSKHLYLLNHCVGPPSFSNLGPRLVLFIYLFSFAISTSLVNNMPFFSKFISLHIFLSFGFFLLLKTWYYWRAIFELCFLNCRCFYSDYFFQ